MFSLHPGFSVGDLSSNCTTSADCTITGSFCSSGICACSSELTEYNGKCVAGKVVLKKATPRRKDGNRKIAYMYNNLQSRTLFQMLIFVESLG